MKKNNKKNIPSVIKAADSSCRFVFLFLEPLGRPRACLERLEIYEISAKMREKKDVHTLANPTCRFRVQPTSTVTVYTVYFSTASGLIHKMSKVLARCVSIDSKMSTCLDAPWNDVICGQNGSSDSSEALGERCTYLGFSHDCAKCTS
jgi:hypothetical protein